MLGCIHQVWTDETYWLAPDRHGLDRDAIKVAGAQAVPHGSLLENISGMQVIEDGQKAIFG